MDFTIWNRRKIVVEPFIDDNLPITWIFTHNNGLIENPIEVSDWPEKSPDLNPIGNLRNDMKS